MIVLDASVVLKWIFQDEGGGAKATYYRDKHIAGEEPAAVPELLFYEVANVLTTKTTLPVDAASQAFQLLWDIQLEAFSFGHEEYLRGIALARKYRISLYDAAYVELARTLQCAFVTADRKLYEKAKGLKKIMLL